MKMKMVMDAHGDHDADQRGKKKLKETVTLLRGPPMGQETNRMRTPYQERNLGTHLFAQLTLPSIYVLISFRFLYVFSSPWYCSALYFVLNFSRWLTEQLLSNGTDSSLLFR